MTKILYIAATIPVVSLVMALVLLLFGPSEQGVDQGETLQFDRLTKTQPSQSGVRVNMKARDGETIAVQHFASAAPLKLILLHGSGYQGAYLYPLAAHLAKAGEAEVYVPNLRGHHLSGERRGDIDYEDQLTDDITDIIGFIRRDRPLAPLVFAGHSSGGGLAVRYAGSKDGKLAQSYLMLAPFLGHDAPTARKNSRVQRRGSLSASLSA